MSAQARQSTKCNTPSTGFNPLSTMRVLPGLKLRRSAHCATVAACTTTTTTTTTTVSAAL